MWAQTTEMQNPSGSINWSKAYFLFYYFYLEANRNKGLSRCENIKLPSTLTGAFYFLNLSLNLFSKHSNQSTGK